MMSHVISSKSFILMGCSFILGRRNPREPPSWLPVVLKKSFWMLFMAISTSMLYVCMFCPFCVSVLKVSLSFVDASFSFRHRVPMSSSICFACRAR